MPGNDVRSTGAAGEKAAAEYLMEKGYTVICRNFRCRLGEIDIIAENQKYLVFVEVKTRARGSMLLPREAVDAKKRARIIKAAEMYLVIHGVRLQPRFDVIEVVTDGGVASINQIENAFTL